MNFEIGNKVQLLNSVGDILYGNRGIVQAEFYDIPTGKYTYEVYFQSIADSLIVNPEDIGLYNNPHLTSIFTIERIE
jgi:hypothetical protein